jgi:hypothetical protein
MENSQGIDTSGDKPDCSKQASHTPGCTCECVHVTWVCAFPGDSSLLSFLTAWLLQLTTICVVAASIFLATCKHAVAIPDDKLLYLHEYTEACTGILGIVMTVLLYLHECMLLFFWCCHFCYDCSSRKHKSSKMAHFVFKCNKEDYLSSRKQAW